LIDSGTKLQAIQIDSRGGSHAETAHGNQNVAPARGVVREEQRKKSTVWKKEAARQNVAAREHVGGQLKALIFDI